jgi:hypothetical protein
MSTMSGSTLPQKGSIQTRIELETMIRSRDELQGQLERVNQQRGEIAQQRLNAEARANSSTDASLDRRLMREYEQQINALTDRSGQLQRQIAQADEAIAKAVANGVSVETQGNPVTSTVISVPGGGDFSSREALLRDRYESMMIAEGASIVLACVVIGRMLWKRSLRKATANFASASDINGIKVAVDAIAVEVERISENQRYTTKMLQERAQPIPQFESAGSKVPVERGREG